MVYAKKCVLSAVIFEEWSRFSLNLFRKYIHLNLCIFPPFIKAFIKPFTQSFIQPFTQSFIHSIIHRSVYPSRNSIIHSIIHPLSHPSLKPSNLSFNHPSIYQAIQSLIHPLIHPSNKPFIQWFRAATTFKKVVIWPRFAPSSFRPSPFPSEPTSVTRRSPKMLLRLL